MFDIKGISGGVFVTLDYAVGLIMLLWNQEGNTVVKVKPEVPCLPWRTTVISRLTGYFLLWIRSHDVTKSRIIEFWESIYFWVGNRWLWGNNLFSTSDRLLKITLTCHLKFVWVGHTTREKYSQDLINSYLYFIVIHYIFNCSKRKRFKYIFDRCALLKMNFR